MREECQRTAPPRRLRSDTDKDRRGKAQFTTERRYSGHSGRRFSPQTFSGGLSGVASTAPLYHLNGYIDYKPTMLLEVCVRVTERERESSVQR